MRKNTGREFRSLFCVAIAGRDIMIVRRVDPSVRTKLRGAYNRLSRGVMWRRRAVGIPSGLSSNAPDLEGEQPHPIEVSTSSRASNGSGVRPFGLKEHYSYASGYRESPGYIPDRHRALDTSRRHKCTYQNQSRSDGERSGLPAQSRGSLLSRKQKLRISVNTIKGKNLVLGRGAGWASKRSPGRLAMDV